MGNYLELIGLAESTTVEWKQSVSEINEIIETAVAFANTEGGRVFIGVVPDGNIVGVQIGGIVKSGYGQVEGGISA